MKGVRPLTQSEIMLCVNEFSGRFAKRDKALFLTQYYTGRRITQLLSLRLGDILNKPKPEQYQNLVQPLEFRRAAGGKDDVSGKRAGKGVCGDAENVKTDFKRLTYRPLECRIGAGYKSAPPLKRDGCMSLKNMENVKITKRVWFDRRNIKGRLEGQAVLLHGRARAAIREWVLELFGLSYALAENYLFQSRSGDDRAISRFQAYRIYRAVFDRLGLGGRLGTHSLRKTFASEMYDRLGRDLIKTQRALDHVKIDSTTAYLGFRQEEIDDAIGAMPDVGGGE